MSIVSRTLVACSLVFALSSQTAAARSFARPPHAPPAAAIEMNPDDVVEQVVDRAALRAKLAEQRAANLARFRAYRTAGVYPSNVYKAGLANVWRDQDGHYCAAATIIRASGQAALVARVAEQDNFIRLADVTTGPLMDWILTSGLTQDELALIQRPFRRVTPRPELQPQRPLPVEASLRAAETRRLAKLYEQIERQLAANGKASLDAAVDRLMQHPQLAAAFLGG